MEKFISVVIPTYNRKDLLKMVLESLYNQTYKKDKYEVVVVDSNSDDGTPEMIEALELKPPLKYIRQENRGRSGARNTGIKEAKGEIILFTDADILASPDLLEEHGKSHKEYPGEAVVGLEVQVSTIEEYNYFKENPEKRNEIHPPHRKKISWLYFMTGNASAPREKLIEAGMFDEEFQGYGWEDIELGYRLNKIGVDINYRRSAVNYHLHPVPFPKRCEIMNMAGQSAVKFYRKHKDWKIRYLLGMNPLSMNLHSLINPEGWFLKMCKRNFDKKTMFRKISKDIILQYHYLNGVKKEW